MNRKGRSIFAHLDPTNARSYGPVLAMTALCLLASCGDDGKDTEGPGLGSVAEPDPAPVTSECNVATDFCLAPFPSSVFEAEETGAATGRRLALETQTAFEPIADLLGENPDGFSTTGVISTMFPVQVDQASLPGTLSESVSADSAVFIVGMDPEHPHYLVRQAFSVEARDISETALQETSVWGFLPSAPLAFDTRYMVVVTNAAKDADGNPLEPNSATDTLLNAPSSIKEDDALHAHLGTYKTYGALLNELGVEKADVVQVWDFHTQSKASTTRIADEVAAYTNALLEDSPPEPRLHSVDDVFWGHERIEVSFEVPRWHEGNTAMSSSSTKLSISGLF